MSGCSIANRGHGRGTAECFGNDLHVRMIREHRAKAREGGRLIVYGYDSK